MAEEKTRLRLAVPCVTCALLWGEDRSWSELPWDGHCWGC